MVFSPCFDIVLCVVNVLRVSEVLCFRWRFKLHIPREHPFFLPLSRGSGGKVPVAQIYNLVKVAVLGTCSGGGGESGALDA